MTNSGNITEGLSEGKTEHSLPFQTGDNVSSFGGIGFHTSHEITSSEPPVELTPDQINELFIQKNMKYYHIHYFSGASELLMFVDDRSVVNYATVMSYSHANQRVSQLLGKKIKVKHLHDLIAGR